MQSLFDAGAAAEFKARVMRLQRTARPEWGKMRERSLLLATIDQVVAAGNAGCTTHPHSFLGQLQPDEWGVLMYEHFDHHLRQFGV